MALGGTQAGVGHGAVGCKLWRQALAALPQSALRGWLPCWPLALDGRSLGCMLKLSNYAWRLSFSGRGHLRYVYLFAHEPVN
jgi:hypothetical protein